MIALKIKDMKIFFKKYFSLIYILIVYILFSLYKIITIPLSIDEAYTYNLFVSKKLWDCVSFYPAPNNHILYSIIAWFFNIIPINKLILLRLPLIIIGCFGIFIFYKYFLKYFHKITANILTLMFAFN